MGAGGSLPAGDPNESQRLSQGCGEPTVRELDKLVEVFEISEKFTQLRDPSAAITWARELMGVSKTLLLPSVVDAVVKKVNQKRITNSKDLRKLRPILPDPVARAHFLAEDGDLDSAQLRLRPAEKKSDDGFLTDLGRPSRP